MRALARTFVRFCLLIGFWICSAVMVVAACSDLDRMGNTLPEGYNISVVQQGLRVAQQDDNSLLSDRRLGVYTRKALQRLCVSVPRTNGGDDVKQTLDLAVQYANLDIAAPNWSDQVFAPAFLAKLTQRDENRLAPALRLAGTEPAKLAVLLDAPDLLDCALISQVRPGSVTAAQAIQTLSGSYSADEAAQLCATIPINGTGDDFLEALAAFRRLEQSLPGALSDLNSPAFAAWIAQDSEQRLRRLLGTQPAVEELLVDFRTSKRGNTVPPAISGCTIDTTDRTLSYTSFGQKELEQLSQSVELTPALEALADQEFDSPDDLWDAMEPQITGLLDDCIVQEIKQLVTNPDRLGQVFQLDKDKTASLAFAPTLQNVTDIVEGFLERRAASEDALVTGLSAALAEAADSALQAEIELAADTLAAAAELVDPIFDTRPQDIPEFEEVEVPETIGVTDATAAAIAKTITNKEFQKALEDNQYLPATKPELLKADVREILRPLATKQVEAIVAEDISTIRPAIKSSWSLTPELQTAILALPDVSATIQDPGGPDLAELLLPLVGVEYPNTRLFQSAVNSLNSGATSQFLQPELVTRAVALAQTEEVENPDDKRLFGPIASDCGCVPKREKNSEVYGFYPFWFAPVVPDAATGIDTDDTPTEDAPPMLELVDFEMISRIAFYGLEFTYANPDAPVATRSLQLNNEQRWTDAKRSFINSAHRHRAKADVTFDLRDWHNWTDLEIRSAVESIARQLAPLRHLPEATVPNLRAALPTIFDRVQPDAATLIFDGYDGRSPSDQQIEKLRRIIEDLYEALPDKKHQTINVAFDFELIDVPGTESLMNDLVQLVTEGDDKIKKIDKILIFLERPTTETKKLLRSRMERGAFQGVQRATVLRSILPVVPPAGHRFVFQRQINGNQSGSQPREFSQFEDDAIYFQDNFAGIAYWPVPLLSNPETAVMKAHLAQTWNTGKLPASLAAFQQNFDDACTWACPNRAYIALIAALIFLVVVGLTWRSFYSGFVDKIAFRLGLVWIGTFAVIGMLFVLTTCDHVATWPPIFLYMLCTVVVIIIGFNFIQRARNGPKP